MNTSTKQLPAFTPVPGFENLWTSDNGSLRCIALRLTDGSICVYSPVSGLGEDAENSLCDFGQVSYLFAPNHYHNKALPEYQTAFPDAALICSEKAKPRLIKQTQLSFETLEQLETLLPANMGLHEPDGLKTGEVWIVARNQNHTAWIVTDAFQGAGKVADGPSNRVELLGTFPKFGVGDLDRYMAWLEKFAAEHAPDIIIPCHGAMASAPDLGQQALSVTSAMKR